MAILSVDHAPTDVVLTRKCADVSSVDHSPLAMFDTQLRAAVAASLIGDLPDQSWWQATTVVLFGGLGFRTARSVALPALVSSRLVSRLLVRTLSEHFSMQTGASLHLLHHAYARRTEDAILSVVSTLTPNSG